MSSAGQPACQFFHLHPRHDAVNGMLAIEPYAISRITYEREHGDRLNRPSRCLKAVRYGGQDIAEQIADGDVDHRIERGSRQIEPQENVRAHFHAACQRRRHGVDPGDELGE